MRARPSIPFDLHVLSLPLAFILSQDQTLHCKVLIRLAKGHSSSRRTSEKDRRYLRMTPARLAGADPRQKAPKALPTASQSSSASLSSIGFLFLPPSPHSESPSNYSRNYLCNHSHDHATGPLEAAKGSTLCYYFRLFKERANFTASASALTLLTLLFFARRTAKVKRK